MYRIWFARQLPSQYSSMLDGIAEVAGLVVFNPEPPLQPAIAAAPGYGRHTPPRGRDHGQPGAAVANSD